METEDLSEEERFRKNVERFGNDLGVCAVCSY